MLAHVLLHGYEVVDPEIAGAVAGLYAYGPPILPVFVRGAARLQLHGHPTLTGVLARAHRPELHVVEGTLRPSGGDDLDLALFAEDVEEGAGRDDLGLLTGGRHLDQHGPRHGRLQVDLDERDGASSSRVCGDTHLHLGERVGDRLEGGTGVVEGQDVVEGHALFGRLPGAPLAHAGAVAPAPAGEDEVPVGGVGRRRQEQAGERRHDQRCEYDGAYGAPRTANCWPRTDAVSRRHLARTHQRSLDDRKETFLLHKKTSPA